MPHFSKQSWSSQKLCKNLEKCCPDHLKTGFSDHTIKWSFIEELDHQSKLKSDQTKAQTTKQFMKAINDNFPLLMMVKTFETLADHLYSTNHFPRDPLLSPSPSPGSPEYCFIDTNILIFDLQNLKEHLNNISDTNIIPVISFMVQAELQSQLKRRPAAVNLLKGKTWLDSAGDKVVLESENQMERACQELGLCIKSCGDVACSNSDNKILASCLYWRTKNPNKSVSVITNDKNFALKAKIHGIDSCSLTDLL